MSTVAKKTTKSKKETKPKKVTSPKKDDSSCKVTKDCRKFTVHESSIGISGGRYSNKKGVGTKDAARKACSSIYRKLKKAGKTMPKSFTFVLREVTRGSNKKRYFYKGSFSLLKKPKVISIKVGNGATTEYMVNHDYKVERDTEKEVELNMEINEKLKKSKKVTKTVKETTKPKKETKSKKEITTKEKKVTKPKTETKATKTKAKKTKK